MITPSVSLFFAALAAGTLFAWFLRLEREGRSAIVVLTILGLVVVEAVIYPSQNDIPSGLFHPSGGGMSLRLVDAVIPIALAARLIGRDIGRRIEMTSLWWLAFLAWLSATGAIGVLAGNDRTLVAYEGKALLYVGIFVLAAGIRPEEYLAHGRLDRFLYGAAVLAAIVGIMDRSQVRIDVDNPLLPLVNAGSAASDAGTILGGLGVIALALALCRSDRRLGLLLASAPLMYAVVFSNQRAAVIGVGTSVVMMVVLCVLRPDRVKATPTELGLVLLVAAGLFVLPPLIDAASGKPDVRPPLVTSIERTFSGGENELTAESRLDQWKAARIVIGERPLLGAGLGTTYRYYDAGLNTVVRTNLTHDIYLDLWLRTGIVGIFLFVIAAASTIRGGVRTWWRGADIAIASFALGVTVVFAGLLGKGLVESLFEKYRLATFMGLIVGMVCSTIPAYDRVEAREPLAESTEALQWS